MQVLKDRVIVAYDTKHLALWQYSNEGMMNDALPCGEEGTAELVRVLSGSGAVWGGRAHTLAVSVPLAVPLAVFVSVPLAAPLAVSVSVPLAVSIAVSCSFFSILLSEAAAKY